MTPSYFWVNLFYWPAWCLYSVFQEWRQITLQRADRKMLTILSPVLYVTILSNFIFLALLDSRCILYLLANKF